MSFAAGPRRWWIAAVVLYPTHVLDKSLGPPSYFQSPRAICSARTMQVSLGGRPHRSDRSQSPRVKSATRRIVAILLATLAKMPTLILLMGPSCAFRWDLGMYRSEEPLPCCGAFLDPCCKLAHEDTWCALTQINSEIVFVTLSRCTGIDPSFTLLENPARDESTVGSVRGSL
jgi:hypothetical protein